VKLTIPTLMGLGVTVVGLVLLAYSAVLGVQAVTGFNAGGDIFKAAIQLAIPMPYLALMLLVSVWTLMRGLGLFGIRKTPGPEDYTVVKGVAEIRQLPQEESRPQKPAQ
jgi:hypothetical protein